MTIGHGAALPGSTRAGPAPRCGARARGDDAKRPPSARHVQETHAGAPQLDRRADRHRAHRSPTRHGAASRCVHRPGTARSRRRSCPIQRCRPRHGTESERISHGFHHPINRARRLHPQLDRDAPSSRTPEGPTRPLPTTSR